MANNKSFNRILSPTVRIRVMFSKEEGKILLFTVQMEVKVNANWLPAIRYDTFHKFPHIDVLDINNRVISKKK